MQFTPNTAPTKNQPQSSRQLYLSPAVSAIMLKRFGLSSPHQGMNQVSAVLT